MGNLSAAGLSIITLKAVGFIVVGIFFGKFALAKLIVRLDRREIASKYPESIFIFAIMVAFFYALAAEYVGLSAIVGSFLAGASFAGVKLNNGRIFKEGAEHLQIIFASIFFVSLGVIMDLHQVTLDLLWFILVLSAVAIVTKVIGCGVPALLVKINFRDSLILGTGMVPRGEVAMIVGLIGLNQGLIDQGTYSAVILTSLTTTILPPIFLRNWLFKK